jgi:hypothetical protein
MKRVVTGEQDGRSLFLDVTDVDTMDPVVVQNMDIHLLWGYDKTPTAPFPGPGNDHEGGFYGKPDQLRVVMIKFGPDAVPEVLSEPEDQLSSLIESDGRHTTDSFDVDFMIYGELGLEVDEGEIQWLTAGDVVIQHGAAHKWHNRSGKDALIGAITVGLGRTQAGA